MGICVSVCSTLRDGFGSDVGVRWLGGLVPGLLRLGLLVVGGMFLAFLALFLSLSSLYTSSLSCGVAVRSASCYGVSFMELPC
jgi:hypothetical protein